jgi:hypothetical protein
MMERSVLHQLSSTKANIILITMLIVKFFYVAVINLCWPHIALNALPENKAKFTNVKFFDEAQQKIADLQLSRSEQQFDDLALIILRHWELKRESTLMKWFGVECLTSPYNRWGITPSGIPGSDPNSNTIESSHRDDKRSKFGQDGKDDVMYF